MTLRLKTLHVSAKGEDFSLEVLAFSPTWSMVKFTEAKSYFNVFFNCFSGEILHSIALLRMVEINPAKSFSKQGHQLICGIT